MKRKFLLLLDLIIVSVILFLIMGGYEIISRPYTIRPFPSGCSSGTSKCLLMKFNILAEEPYVIGNMFHYQVILKNVGVGSINTTANITSNPPDLLNPYPKGNIISVKLTSGEEKTYPEDSSQLYCFNKLGSNTIYVKFDDEVFLFRQDRLVINQPAEGKTTYPHHFDVVSIWEKKWSDDVTSLNEKIFGLGAIMAIFTAINLVIAYYTYKSNRKEGKVTKRGTKRRTKSKTVKSSRNNKV